MYAQTQVFWVCHGTFRKDLVRVGTVIECAGHKSVLNSIPSCQIF